MLPFDVPVDPDAPEGREWLERELGQDAYAGSGRSFLDEIVRWFERLFDGLFGTPGNGSGSLGLVLVILVVAAVVVAAFLIAGLPRLRRRSRVTGELFGEDDRRDALGIRSAAERAAAAGDYTTAVVECFRALARGLAERGIVTTFPGTTARDFARRATTPFPAAADRLVAAARLFDEVRYLGGSADAADWERTAALERELRRARPAATPSAGDVLAGTPR